MVGLAVCLVVANSDGRWGAAVLVAAFVEISLYFWGQPKIKSSHSLFQQVSFTEIVQIIRNFINNVKLRKGCYLISMSSYS